MEPTPYSRRILLQFPTQMARRLSRSRTNDHAQYGVFSAPMGSSCRPHVLGGSGGGPHRHESPRSQPAQFALAFRFPVYCGPGSGALLRRQTGPGDARAHSPDLPPDRSRSRRSFVRCRLSRSPLTPCGFKRGSGAASTGQLGRRHNFAAFIFAVGSTIFFSLFLKSRSIPRLLAGWGLFASLLAMSACLAHLVRPSFSSMNLYAWVPMLLTETSTGLWLLIKSVKVPQPSAN